MSLKPKQRLNVKPSLDITGYNDEFNRFYSKNNYGKSSKKDTLFQLIRWKQLLILYTILFGIIHYFERIQPINVLKSCAWNNWEQWPENSNPHHSIIIGDPQLVDEYSYPNRTWVITSIFQRLADNYLHRNHNLYNKILNPDSIIFVGDLFDGGREWDDTQWIKEYRRFNNVFNPLQGVRQFRQVPGNHDVGFGNGIDFDRYERFKAYFGNADEVVVIGNHSLVLLDTVSLSCTEDPRVSEASDKFVSRFSDPTISFNKYPRIAISHVPLYRFTEFQTCGKLRESDKKFPVIRGKQYQTVLEYDMSQRIINTIKPILIFSGDDHDYCHIRHPHDKSFSTLPSDYEFSNGDHPGLQYTDEVTIKASSASGGIRKPGIQLLSLWNPENIINDNWNVKNSDTQTVDSETATTHLCYLPSKFQPLLYYISFLVLSICWIFLCTVQTELGHKLNVVFERNIIKFTKIIQRLFKKDIKAISMHHFEKRNPAVYERYFSYILFEWEIEHSKNWKSFLFNSGLLFILEILTLTWYFKSI